MKKLEAVIFDIDGTLTSTNELIFSTFNHVSNKYLDKTLSEREIVSYFGPPEDVILKELFTDNHELVINDYYEFYESNHKKMADLFPGMKEIILFLHKNKIPLGIFTGKGRKSALITLQQCSVENYFDIIITGDDVENHKPAPDGLEIIVDFLKVDKENTILVGDAPGDIKAARSAGIKIGSVIWDSYDKEKVISMESDYLFENVKDLEEFFYSTLS
ncbi:MAG: HAD family hydrolase [Ignavibacteria bacterium]